MGYKCRRHAKKREILYFKYNKRHCRYCGKELLFSETTLEHLVPHSHGLIDNTVNNLDIACKDCNNWRGEITSDIAQLRQLETTHSNWPLHRKLKIERRIIKRLHNHFLENPFEVRS